MGCSKDKRGLLSSLELIMSGIVFGLWNNVSTVLNAKILFETGHNLAGGFTLFFLMFPGLVTSIGFLVLHWLGHKRLGRIPSTSVIAYFFLLLFFYPVVPIALCIYTLCTGKNRELAIMSKLFEGFLDDGPQFVLRLVVVVLFGIGIGQDKHNIIFIMSMVTSFGALVYFGLQFNERNTTCLVKWFLCLPMFAASVAARGFTLAVFLKETVDHKSEWIGGLVVLAIYFAFNVATFKVCGQDSIRSVVFGFSSTLIPVGYNNDPYFYQCPHQPLSGNDPSNYNGGNNSVVPESLEMNPQEEIQEPVREKMKSGLFLVLHTVINTLLLSSCAIYISMTRDLSESSDNALILPQILAVIPGCFFTLARSVLVIDEMKPKACHEKVWTVSKVILATLFGIIAYGSLIPAAFWSLLWKVTDLAADLIDED